MFNQNISKHYLVNQFMCDDTGNSLLVVRGWLVFIIKQVGFPVGDKPPVLHGTSTKVRNGYLIWIQTAERYKSPHTHIHDYLRWPLGPLLPSPSTSSRALLRVLGAPPDSRVPTSWYLDLDLISKRSPTMRQKQFRKQNTKCKVLIWPSNSSILHWNKPTHNPIHNPQNPKWLFIHYLNYIKRFYCRLESSYQPCGELQLHIWCALHNWDVSELWIGHEGKPQMTRDMEMKRHVKNWSFCKSVILPRHLFI